MRGPLTRKGRTGQTARTARTVMTLSAFTTLLSPVTLISPAKLVLAATLDSSFLQKQPRAFDKRKKKAAIQPSPSVRKTLKIEEPTDTESAEKVSYLTIESFTQLLKAAPVGPAQNALLLNRAAAMSRYARKNHLASGRPTMAENLKAFLRASIRDAELVQASPQATPAQLERIHHLVGYAYVYLDEPRRARIHFLEILRTKPGSERAGWIALYIAEDLFEEGKFLDAAAYYSGFQARMSTQGQQLAQYKLAWCKINLGANEEAEKLFLKLALADSRQGLGRDSVRDLAYLVAHRKKPEVAIREIEIQFVQVPEKIEFLNAVRGNLETQGAVEVHSKVVQRLLELEKDRGRRLELFLADLRIRAMQYADRGSAAAFARIDAHVRAAGLTASSPELAKLSAMIESETIAVIKAFVDTYAGRTQSPEKFTRQDLETELKRQFRFFVEFVPESRQRPRIAGLWLDVCLSAADWAGVDEASEIMIADKARLQPLAERAYVAQIAALEKLGNRADAAHAARRRQRMKDFVTLFPASDQWLRVARLHAQTEVEQGNDGDMLVLLEKIHLREPTPDSYYRLQYSRFKAKQYVRIIEDPEAPKFSPPEPRLADLWRETALALAQQARESEDLVAYQKYVHRFLELKPDEKKAFIAREDYFTVLLEAEKEEDATREFLALDRKIRTAAPLSNLRLRLWSLNMKKSRYLEAAQLSHEQDGGARDPEIAYRYVLSNLALGKAARPELLQALSQVNRTYILGILALVKPEAALTYFRANAPTSASDRELAALSIRVTTGNWEIERSPQRIALLGANFHFLKIPNLAPLGFERRIEKIRFPGPKTKAAALNTMVPRLVAGTRAIRSSVSKEIEGKELVVQLRGIEKVRDLETRVARTLLESPVPKELTEEQRLQYQAGIKEAAAEFEAQSVEFERSAVILRTRIEQIRTERDSRIIAAPELKDWNWGSKLESDALRPVAAALKSGNTLGALAILDFLRDQEVPDGEDYFRIRAGILLSSSKSESLRMYLLAELESAGRKDLIEEWKGKK